MKEPARSPRRGHRGPRILGVDPGTRAVGFAVLEAGSGCRLREFGTIRLRASETIPKRLAEIYRALVEVIARHKPTVVAVEKVFHGKNFQSAMKVGEARGVVLLAGARAGIPIVEYTPAMVKKAATGNGNASKRQVQRMMARLLHLGEIPEPADAADALAIAFCHTRKLRRAGLGLRDRGESPLQSLINSIKRSKKRVPNRGASGSRRLPLFLDRGNPVRSGGKKRMTQESKTKNKASQVMAQSELKGLKLIGRGKVRDIYDLGENLLIVASDRLSAFDVVLPDPIPDKGRVLTRLSVFWFGTLEVPNHLVASDVGQMPSELQPFAEQLEDRVMLVRRLQIFPIECVVRGYLSGSGWKDYKKTGSICGIKLPEGLVESDRLPEPIFTPSTKAASGHDEPITFGQVVETVGEARAVELRDKTLSVYQAAAEYARKRGIIICDTKFEWGIPLGAPQDDPQAAPAVLADEVLTPDSSRFWPESEYKPGRGQPSFDKQYVRDYLLTLDWDQTPPAPKLPPDVIEHTSAKYREIYKRLTGRKW